MKRFSNPAGRICIYMLAPVLLTVSCTQPASKIYSSSAVADKGMSDSVPARAPLMPGEPMQLDSSKRYIFLTWDDSPQHGTRNCKKVFKEEGVKATFFSVSYNQTSAEQKMLMDSIRSEYPLFLLANHSSTHGFRNRYAKFYSPLLTDSAVHDFLKNEHSLQIPVKILRFPGHNTWALNGRFHGQQTDKPLVKRLDSMGYKIVGWDMEWNQKKDCTPRESAYEMANRVTNRLDKADTRYPNTVVILSHDRLFAKPQYADSLRRFIAMLKQDPRNVFETIDHYPPVHQKK